MAESGLSAGERATADVVALLRARNPLIWIVSREEKRVERAIMAAAQSTKYGVVCWDTAGGVTAPGGAVIDASVTDPAAICGRIRESSDREIWILRDHPAHYQDPYVRRALRSLVRFLPSAPSSQARAVVIIAPSGDVPADLADAASVVEWPLPDRAEIGTLLDAAIAALPESYRAGAAPNGRREAAIDAAVGLSADEALGCYARSLISVGPEGVPSIDPALVSREKKRVISRERVLEWIEPLAGGLESVGGLDLLKAWLVARKSGFSAAAREFGLPPPKGALMVGVPGGGKSLTAKALATAWEMPLLRLDMGALRSKFVGESEANIRKALKVAETVAPCVLWLDEIEKALAGSSSGASDGGVAADALGAVLSWMQDRAGSVFVIATANDVSALPPELLRKGRFDELWFVDLPTAFERFMILSVALASYGRELMDVDLEAVAAVTAGFTGAELSALIPDALYAAFADGKRAVTADDLVTAAKATVPLSVTAKGKIDLLREWAKGRARPASMPERAAATGAGFLGDLELAIGG